MEKTKEIFKKFILCIISSLIIISGLVTNAFALTGTTGAIIHKDWVLTDPITGKTNGTEGYLLVNNQPVFCVDYFTDFHSNKTVTQGSFKDIGISEEKAKRLSLIAYFGTKVEGRTSTDWYAITQGLIWRTIHEDDTLQFVRTNTTPDYVSTQRAWNQILADVDRYYTAPSFTTSSHEVDADKTLELTDTNGVLSDMTVLRDGGLDVSIQANRLIINGQPNADEETTIILRKKIADSETGTSIVYTAPDCQAVASFKVSDPMQTAFKVKVNKFGKLELIKYNEDKSGTVPNTTYHITGPNGYDQKLTTDSTGKISLDRIPIGYYTAVEEKAGDGYLINVQEFGFTIEANQTTHIDPTNIEPTGKIDLVKSIDSSQTNGLIGDAVLEGNTYELHAKDKITNKAGTKVFYQKDQLVSTKDTDTEGKITWDNLPLGNYYILEKKSNDSLVVNEQKIDISLEYQGQTVSKVIKETETSNRVNMQKIRVFKSGEKDGISGIVKGLQGAEFTFKLKSEVDHVGWDNAKTYAVITTDRDGVASTPFMPNGKFLVKETKTPKDYITAPDFIVSVTDDYSEYVDVEQVKQININNRPFTSQLKIVKVDKETGKTVTLNSASFKIKNSKGDYVVQKVAGIKFDTFTTNSDNQIIPLGEKGTVMLPLSLDADTYEIEEIKVPDGFLKLEEPIKFTISNIHDYDKDEDEEPILVVKFENEQPKGKIVIRKTDKETALPLENVEYELTAKQDIISAIDGSVLFKKGDLVSKGSTSSNGEMIIDNLFMGNYSLKETLTNPSYVLSEETHDIVFEPQDTTTKVYEIGVDVTNIAPKGEIHIVKTDKDTAELLSGVIYQLSARENIYSLDGRNTLLYKAGELVSVDISQDGLYMTDERGEIHISVPLGKYELKEFSALEGYYTDKTIYEIDLTYDHTDRIIYTKELELTNEKSNLEISKVDITDEKELEGAHLALYDKDNNLVEEWISEENPHIIRGLKVDEKYRLHEDLAPLGYTTANDITFKLEDNGEVTKVIMKDEITKVDISKVDATTGKELEGAKMILTDKETGEVIDSWISTKEPHRILGLAVDKTHILHEEIAPEGYLVASDIEFTVVDTGEVQKVVMVDELKPTPPVQTGDNTSIYTIVVIAGASLLLTVAIVTRIKRKRNEKK